MIIQLCEAQLRSRGSSMGMLPATLACRPSPSASQLAELRLAASKLTGPQRRALEAEMPLQ
jgi:hypothetical protein